MKTPDKKDIFVYGGLGLTLIAIALLIVVLVSSCAGGGYGKHFAAAEEAFLAEDYEAALTSAQKALEADATEECYLLIAEIYMEMGDIDSAIETLYVASVRISSGLIHDRLEELKDRKAELAAIEEANSVTVGGETFGIDETSAVLSQKGITDADMLLVARLTELTSLSLTENNISNIAPLAPLTKLTSLALSNNAVSDISVLAGMTELKTLYLDANPITDFSPLYGLTKLSTLSIKGISITEEKLSELQGFLPNCSIYCDDVEESVEEITIGGVTIMTNVAELDLSGRGIVDLTGLEKCTELTKLDLRDNMITDVSALRDLQKLEWLCLWNNEISDIRPLMTLSKLRYLDVEDNILRDISTLAATPALEELWLSGNELQSLTALESLTSLRRLGLKNTGLTDEDIDLLMGMNQLAELSIDDNEELSAEKVDELKEALPGCTISHSELFYSAQLGSLTVKSNAESVDAVGVGAVSLEGLERFEKLTKLLISNNAVTDLSPLAKLKQLEILEADGNALTNLAPIAGLSELRILSLMYNDISDLTPLAGCRRLQELHLSHNARLVDISALAQCTELTDLSLDNCGVQDLTALAGLTHLRYLSLSGNHISDVTPLFGLGSLETLYLEGNALTPAQIDALRAALPNCAIFAGAAA